MHTRENKLVQNKRFSVVVIPKFINVLTDSNNISVSKGGMHFFIREQSKRQIIDIDTEKDNHLLELAKEKIEQLDLKKKLQDILQKMRIQRDLLKDKEKLVKQFRQSI